MMSGSLGTKDSRFRREQRSGVALRAREPPRPTIPPARKQGPALLLPQVFDGDVAPQKSVFHDLEFGLKTMELRSVGVKAVGGPGAAEEGEEATEHAQA